jgi:hypothetical protein
MYSSDATIEAAALACLESLIKTLYPTSGDSPAGLAQDVIKESLALLDEPEKSQATSGVKVIACLLRASRASGTTTTSELTSSKCWRIRVLPGFTSTIPPIQQPGTPVSPGSHPQRNLVPRLRCAIRLWLFRDGPVSAGREDARAVQGQHNRCVAGRAPDRRPEIAGYQGYCVTCRATRFH